MVNIDSTGVNKVGFKCTFIDESRAILNFSRNGPMWMSDES